MILLQCDGMESWVKGCNVCIPGKIGSLVSTIYTAILIAVPLLLILSGMLTMATSVMKQSEDEIKKAQKLLVKKITTGVIVFLLFALVRWLVSYFDNSLTTCFDALINYNETEKMCVAGADGCGGGSNNNFYDFNNQCQTEGADGAVKIGSTFYCYVKDYENCSCTDGTPFKYTTGNSTGGCDCHCAKQVWNDSIKQYEFSATAGTCR